MRSTVIEDDTISAPDVKDGLSLKIKIVDIHLYFIATNYLWNNTLVEYINS